jgi:6-phosphogluconolactonase
MIQTFADKEALSRSAAELIADQAVQIVAQQGRCSLALSGGSTPQRTYELLAQAPFRERVPWANVHLFWGDERCVPPGDQRSNYRMTKLALLDHVPIPAANLHRIRGELPPQDGAADYEREVKQFFAGRDPSFDLVLLGLGDNGHTASLWPGTPVVHETERWLAEVYVAEQDLWRVTMTARLLNEAALTAFLVSGAAKAPVVREIRTGPFQPDHWPAQLIKPRTGRLLWLLDREAARLS